MMHLAGLRTLKKLEVLSPAPQTTVRLTACIVTQSPAVFDSFEYNIFEYNINKMSPRIVNIVEIQVLVYYYTQCRTLLQYFDSIVIVV